MGWSNKWDNDLPQQQPSKGGRGGTQIIDTPKPFSEVLKEHNAVGDKIIKDPYLEGIQNRDKPTITIGVDKGSIDGDKCLVTLFKDGQYHLIGEGIELCIPEGWNNKVVKAIQIGDLAVVTTEGEEHCIAHVPTQTWFDNAIPDGTWTQEQLLMWAWKVQLTNCDMWKHLHSFTNETYKTISKDFLESFKCSCLSVPLS